MSPTPTHVTLPEAEFEAFDVLSFGSVTVPAKSSRIGFQIDVKAAQMQSQVMFGLVQPASKSRGMARVGFAVRVDLERGEIWDLVNGSGLIGWVESPLKDAAADENFLLSLEIERIGSALLPKLQIGGEEWLYPAVRSQDSMELLAVAGCCDQASNPVDASGMLINPSVWCEEAA